MINILKFCIAWIIGVILAVFAMSLSGIEEINWFSLIVGSFTGALIVSGITMYMNKAKDRTNG